MADAPKYGRGQVIEIINSVIDKIDVGSTRDVYQHIAELASIIDTLKKDIAAMQPEHVKNSHIPDATDELDAVVVATEEATHKIMSVCENMEALAETLDGSAKETLAGHVTQIYEACTFQDITGQRIRNVVSTLRVIENKVEKILDTLGDKVGLKISTARPEKIVSVDDDKSLLNGPQLPDKAITQAEIDKLLAEFDS